VSASFGTSAAIVEEDEGVVAGVELCLTLRFGLEDNWPMIMVSVRCAPATAIVSSLD
jgi:hypothetical protein